MMTDKPIDAKRASARRRFARRCAIVLIHMMSETDVAMTAIAERLGRHEADMWALFHQADMWALFHRLIDGDGSDLRIDGLADIASAMDCELHVQMTGYNPPTLEPQEVAE